MLGIHIRVLFFMPDPSLVSVTEGGEESPSGCDANSGVADIFPVWFPSKTDGDELARPSRADSSLGGIRSRSTGLGVRSRRRRRRATLDRLDMTRTAELSRSTQASPASLVVALLYLERLRTANPNYLGTVSSTDLFLVSLVSWQRACQSFMVLEF